LEKRFTVLAIIGAFRRDSWCGTKFLRFLTIMPANYAAAAAMAKPARLECGIGAAPWQPKAMVMLLEIVFVPALA
jgi:hypothetical protein